MKTIHEYEASDIDIKENKLHSFLMGQILIVALSGKEMSKANPNDPEDKLYGINKVIAQFLTSMEREGFTITGRETVPDIFRVES